MTELLRVLVLLAVAAAAFTGWRLWRYPGGWAYAFSREHTGPREDLGRARRQAHALDRASKRERRTAHTGLRREEVRHRERVRTVERRIATLRRPGRGSMITQLGGVTLYEHSVVVDGREVPLADVTVRLEHARHQHVLHLTQPGGRVRVQCYSRSQHDEDAVRRLAAQVENAVTDETAFRIRTAAQLEQAEQELIQARADTAAQDQARVRITEVEERQRRDTRRQAAHKELEAARDRWHDLTGKRPRA